RLLERVQREAQRAVESYDQEAEASRLADSVQKAVASAAALQVGALGLGTVLVILATTTMADITGILAASAMSLIGLLVLPAPRAFALPPHIARSGVNPSGLFSMSGGTAHQHPPNPPTARSGVNPSLAASFLATDRRRPTRGHRRCRSGSGSR